MAVYTGDAQGEIIGSPPFNTEYGIEIWVSDTQSGTYEFLASVGAGLSEQTYPHRPLSAALTRWYKLRYRTKQGGYSSFSSAKKGTTSYAFSPNPPTASPVPSAL